jgi:hypothetical protein
MQLIWSPNYKVKYLFLTACRSISRDILRAKSLIRIYISDHQIHDFYNNPVSIHPTKRNILLLSGHPSFNT